MLFRKWLDGLADRRAPERISRRIVVVVPLCGGDKGSQSRDIRCAKALAAELED